MKPIDFILIGVIALILVGAIAYIIKAKKSGQECIGCPNSKSCGKSGDGCCCHCEEAKLEDK